MKNYTENFSDNAIKQADTLGWALMATGISEITEKNIPEILFRIRFLDMTWGKPYFVQDPSDTSITMMLQDHIGLKVEITNRGIKNLNTRRRFMVNQLSNLEERVERKIKKNQVSPVNRAGLVDNSPEGRRID
jgi:hypothetical protein